jgi:hypothetical protein
MPCDGLDPRPPYPNGVFFFLRKYIKGYTGLA